MAADSLDNGITRLSVGSDELERAVHDDSIQRRKISSSEHGPGLRPIPHSPFLTLPDELVMGIFGKLQIQDLIRAQRVCKKWKSLIEDPVLKRALFLLPHPPSPLATLNPYLPHILSSRVTIKPSSPASHLKNETWKNMLFDSRGALDKIRLTIYCDVSKTRRRALLPSDPMGDPFFVRPPETTGYCLRAVSMLRVSEQQGPLTLEHLVDECNRLLRSHWAKFSRQITHGQGTEFLRWRIRLNIPIHNSPFQNGLIVASKIVPVECVEKLNNFYASHKWAYSNGAKPGDVGFPVYEIDVENVRREQQEARFVIRPALLPRRDWLDWRDWMYGWDNDGQRFEIAKSFLEDV